VGVVAASGTGLQSVTSNLTRMGVGISQAIGTGGRDLSTDVGGIMMLEGVKALQVHPGTEVLLLVSKPPAPEIAEKVLDQLKASEKPAVVCFLGGDPEMIRSAGGLAAATLEEAAYLAAALAGGGDADEALRTLSQQSADLKKQATYLREKLQPGQRYLRGLFSGGTFCYETQLILGKMGLEVVSNAPVDKRLKMEDANVSVGHAAVDLGEDEFTVGRLHPMLDPTLRNRRIVREAEDPETAIIFLDVVLGYGVHPDPAGAAVEAMAEAREVARADGREVIFVASVCGTADDPQDLHKQEAKLEAAGVVVLPTNAAATRLAGHILDF
jgi:FdrA protein